jgi:hypothetical protein
MNPRVRRVLFIVTTGAVLARLYVLGEQKGFALVGRATVAVTLASLAAWLVHMTVHELAHWAAAVSQNFEIRGVRLGLLALDFTGPRVQVRRGNDLGGAVISLPRGAQRLSSRLRIVALAGPSMTLLVTLVGFAVWRSSGQAVATPTGIFVVMGALTLVTALLPGALLPNRPASGTDLEQALQPRAVFAYWVNAAALQGIAAGKRVSEVLDWRTVQGLLPEPTGEAEPIELGWCIAALDAGHPGLARPRLRSIIDRLDEDSPDWLRTDTFNQLGCLSALDGDPLHASACLAEVKQTQSMDWYCELLVACIAKARGEPFEPALTKWRAAAEAHPGRAFAIGGNEWVLARLTAR